MSPQFYVVISPRKKGAIYANMTDLVKELVCNIYEKYKDRVRIDTNHSLRYIQKQSTLDKRIVLTVHLPYDCLKEWHCAQMSAHVERHSERLYNVLDVLNEFLYKKTGFRVKRDSQRVKGRLKRICGEVASKFTGKNGTAYRKLCLKESSMALELEDLETLSTLEDEVMKGLEMRNCKSDTTPCLAILKITWMLRPPVTL